MAVAKNVFSLLNLIWFIVIEENFSSVPVIQNAREKKQCLFIHCFFFSEAGALWQEAKKVSPDIPLLSSFWGIARPDEIYYLSNMFWVYPGGLLPAGLGQKMSSGSHPEGILIRCLSHLNILLSNVKKQQSYFDLR